MSLTIITTLGCGLVQDKWLQTWLHNIVLKSIASKATLIGFKSQECFICDAYHLFQFVIQCNEDAFQLNDGQKWEGWIPTQFQLLLRKICVRTNPFSTDQLFCVLHPRPQVLPKLWKLSDSTAYPETTQIHSRAEYPSCWKCWQLPIVRWDGPFFWTPALERECYEQEQMQAQLQGCMTHKGGGWRAMDRAEALLDVV